MSAMAPAASAGLRRLLACPTCDLLHERRPLPPRGVARCARCGATLYDERALWLDHALAFALAAAVLLAVSASFPLLTLSLSGLSEAAGLGTGPLELWRQQHGALAALVLVATLVAPGVRLLLLLFVLGSLKLGLRPRGLEPALRVVGRLRDWSMPEVFLLGACVAWIKLGGLAHVGLGPAMLSFGALILVLAAANAALDPRDAWDALERMA